MFVDDPPLIGRAEHAKLLRQIGRAERDRVDARRGQDGIDVLEGLGRLEHDRDVDLAIEVPLVGGEIAAGIEVVARR